MVSTASLSYPPATPTNTLDLRVRRAAQLLIEALQDEALNHGSLRTQRSLRLENDLRLELARPISFLAE